MEIKINPGQLTVKKNTKPASYYAGRSVGLVIPPSPFLLDDRVFPPLGILKIASELEHKGVGVGLLDLAGVTEYMAAVELFTKTNPQFEWIGITVTTPQLPAAVDILNTIKSVRPDVRVVLGGPHVTLTHVAYKAELKRGITNGRAYKAYSKLTGMFDVLVSGDGEFSVFECFEKDCPKLIDADDRKGGYFMSDSDYQQSQWPARHLIDMPSYHYSVDGFNATNLIAQLGCPFYCGFCGGRAAQTLRVIRKRSSDSVVEELEYLYKTYGYTGYMFHDDELNVNPKVVELMNKIDQLQKRLGTEFRFRGFIKAELFTEEQAEAMYRAGFRWLLCGFESAHPRILQNIDKMSTTEDNTRVVEIAHKHGLKVKALMSIGHPGESMETILRTQQWLIDMKVDDFDCTVITTYPGTPYYDNAVEDPSRPGVWTYTHKKTGDRLHAVDVDFTKEDSYYKGDPNAKFTSFTFTDYLQPQEIVEMRNKLEKTVREALNMPFTQTKIALAYEHSMGQGLPASIFKQTQPLPKVS